MDSILAPIQDAFEGQIPNNWRTANADNSSKDFHGQQLAETLSTILLILSGALAFIVGYIQQDVYLMLWVGLAGTAFTALVVVPPWPFYNRNPEAWLNFKKVPGGASGIIVDGVKVG
ncbi:hypothetical protein UA08_02641 [Talaromyces atroroseus]|uniref:Signal peptidase complex subunit 1 n=1 Tax=Talaromyces atroroseus TaxID=1441469 RepID=A0A225AK63_TALAT|nr:hypothetical protein UA08_02641 [Talaromyces atroroseus]OKL61941.1 hypothetical protein UA08_02641 [Talaromyces atroroseus]